MPDARRWYGGFGVYEVGSRVWRYSPKKRRYTWAIWEVAAVEWRDGLSPMLDLVLVDNGSGRAPKKSIKIREDAINVMRSF